MVAQGLGQSERWQGPECMQHTYQDDDDAIAADDVVMAFGGGESDSTPPTATQPLQKWHHPLTPPSPENQHTLIAFQTDNNPQSGSNLQCHQDEHSKV